MPKLHTLGLIFAGAIVALALLPVAKKFKLTGDKGIV